jgi:GntR family transcriptional regulator
LISPRDPLYYNSMTLRTQHDKPVYVRLRETIADAILAGQFADGDPLPSVRALAAQEQANPLTVAKAYQGFQDEGLIVVKRGVGMFVAAGARARLRDSERSRFVKDEWPEIRARMQRLGIDPTELIERERV